MQNMQAQDAEVKIFLWGFIFIIWDDQVLEEVGRSLALLAEIEEDMEESCCMNYVPSLLPRQSHRGRPKFDIRKEQIEHLNLNFTCPKIASLLGVSLHTIRRIMTEYGLSVSGLYSDIGSLTGS